MQTGDLLPSSSSSTATTTATATATNNQIMERDHKLQLHDCDEEDFSFVCANPEGSPISADDAFFNGQIRPVYPLFNQDLLFVEDSSSLIRPPFRKVFLQKPESESEGSYCEWSPATAELGKKSNSTGFSKLRRFRDFMTMHRSSSDGKDAFVFLNNNSSNNNKPPHKLQLQSGPKVKPQTPSSSSSSSSAHETHYIRSRAQKQLNNHKSYLPYRQDLVGFFTTANGFTKNVHPF